MTCSSPIDFAEEYSSDPWCYRWSITCNVKRKNKLHSPRRFRDGRLIHESAPLTEAFTKKHFIAIANILKAHSGEAWVGELANELADMFQEDNSRFDRQRFLSACGV